MTPLASTLFPTFFLGGFECSDHRDWAGRRLDQIGASQHDRQALADYYRCQAQGIGAVRDGVRWPRVDRFAGRGYDWSQVDPLLEAAQATGMVVIWDLFHYGYPDDLDLFSPAFVPRFAAFCHAFAERARAALPADQIWFTPVNEPSFFAWAASDARTFYPGAVGRGWELKRQLVRAHLAGADAFWAAARQARLLSVDPLVRAHAPLDEPNLAQAADDWSRWAVWEAFDLIAGRREPELGGDRRYLGVIGVNMYHICQWEHARALRFIYEDDPRWWPLHRILQFVSDLYGGPLVIGETSDLGAARSVWLRHLLAEVELARQQGVDVQGVCWYPVLTVPDWEDTTAFYEAGLWDAVPQPDHTLARRLYAPLADELRAWQAPFPAADPPLLTEEKETMPR